MRSINALAVIAGRYSLNDPGRTAYSLCRLGQNGQYRETQTNSTRVALWKSESSLVPRFREPPVLSYIFQSSSKAPKNSSELLPRQFRSAYNR